MALYLPVRTIQRNRSIRVGTQKLSHDTTKYIDISDGATRRDLAHHISIGGVVVVGPVSANNSETVVVSGAVVTAQGTPDQTVDVSASELRNRSTGAYVTGAASDNLAATAAHATLARIDIVQVNTTTGVASYKAGTAAASPSAPSPDAGNIAVARVARAANDNTIAAGDITDVRPRP